MIYYNCRFVDREIIPFINHEITDGYYTYYNIHAHELTISMIFVGNEKNLIIDNI